MNFFWEWHTGGGSGSGNYASRASMTDIYAVIHYAQSADGNEEDPVNWDDVNDGATDTFGYPSTKYTYFASKAGDYGVIQ